MWVWMATGMQKNFLGFPFRGFYRPKPEVFRGGFEFFYRKFCEKVRPSRKTSGLGRPEGPKTQNPQKIFLHPSSHPDPTIISFMIIREKQDK